MSENVPSFPEFRRLSPSFRVPEERRHGRFNTWRRTHASCRVFLTNVVKYDNLRIKRGIRWRTANDARNTARFLVQGSTEGIRGLSGRGQSDLSYGPDDRGGGRQGRHCKAPARVGLRRVRDRAAVQGRCLSGGLHGPAWRGTLGPPCLPEEINPRDRDSATGTRA